MKAKTASEIVALARHPQRVTPLDYIHRLFDEFIELHGDRHYADDKAIVGGIATLNGLACTVVAIQKGRDLAENVARHFGSPHPEGYRKALRLMKQAEKFGRPIITFINTPGAFCGIEAEERGEGEAIARNLYEMSDLAVPIIAIFTGEGGSGGAIALGVADHIMMLEHSIYSILSPEGFASILWKDAKRAEEAAKLMKLTAYDLKELGVIDEIVLETQGASGLPLEQALIERDLKQKIIAQLTNLQAIEINELLERRYDRFRQF